MEYRKLARASVAAYSDRFVVCGGWKLKRNNKGHKGKTRKIIALLRVPGETFAFCFEVLKNLFWPKNFLARCLNPV